MSRGTFPLRWITVVGLGGLLAACAGGPASSPGPASGSPSTSSNPTSGPPSPVSERVLVSGTQDCGIDDESRTETTEGQVTTIRGTLRCTDVLSDARVSGVEEGMITLVYADLPALEIDRWSAEMTLSNDGGTWRGTGWGSEFWDAAGGLRTAGTVLYTGEGGYAGLSYRVLVAQSPEWTIGHYIMSGWIEPAD